MLDVALIDPVHHHASVLPELLGDERGSMAAVGLDDIAPLTLIVGEHAWTYRIEDGRVAVEPGRTDGASAVSMSRPRGRTSPSSSDRLADLMHASPRPTGAGNRRVLYVTYYPPTLVDQVGPCEAINDLVRDRQAEAATLAPPSSERLRHTAP